MIDQKHIPQNAFPFGMALFLWIKERIAQLVGVWTRPTSHKSEAASVQIKERAISPPQAAADENILYDQNEAAACAIILGEERFPAAVDGDGIPPATQPKMPSSVIIISDPNDPAIESCLITDGAGTWFTREVMKFWDY